MRSSNSLQRSLTWGAAIAVVSLSALPLSAQSTAHQRGAANNTHSPNKRTANAASSGKNQVVLTGLESAVKQWTEMRSLPAGRMSMAAYAKARAQRARLAYGSVNAPYASIPGYNPGNEAQSMSILPSAPGGIGILPTTGPIDGAGLTGWTNIGPQFITSPNPTPPPFGLIAPTPIWTPPGQTGFGPDYGAGRVNAAVVDPNNSGTIYIAAATGGIWKTVDGGANWLPLTDYPSSGVADGLAFSSLTIDNTGAIYAGTGDYDGTFALGVGLYKSQDGGTTWTKILDPATDPAVGQHSIRKVLARGGTLLVALGRNLPIASIQKFNVGVTGSAVPSGFIYRSTDGGSSFTQTASIPGGFVSNIIANKAGTKLYASADLIGVFVSTDDGQTWTKDIHISSGPTPLFFPMTNTNNPSTQRIDIAASLTEDDTIYALSEYNQAIFKKSTGSVNWLDVTNNFPADYGVNPTPGNPVPPAWQKATTDFFIKTSIANVNVGGIDDPNGPTPKIEELVYVGLNDLFISADGAASWFPVTNTTATFAETHSGQHDLVVNPSNPNSMLLLNDGGIYGLTYRPEDNTFSYASFNATLNVLPAFGSSTHPQDPTYALVGGLGMGTPRANFDLLHWPLVIGGDGGQNAIDPTRPLTQYATAQYGLPQNFFITEESWADYVIDFGTPRKNPPKINKATFNADIPIQANAPFEVPIVQSQANTHLIYSANQTFLVFDHGATVDSPGPYTAGTWTAAGQALTIPYPIAPLPTPNPPADFVTAISASPTNDQVVYAGTLYGGVWFSADRGGTGFRIDGNEKLTDPAPFNIPGLGPLPAAVPIGAIVSSPLNPRRAYVALAGSAGGGIPRVWRCDNITLGKNVVWVPISGSGGGALPDSPLTSMVLIPHDDEKTLYVGGDLGVYVTTNGGANWKLVNAVTDPSNPLVTLPGILPDVQVSQLNYNPSTATLDAATFGRGLWRLNNIGNDQPLKIQTSLQYYRGNKSRLKATVELYHPRIQYGPNNYQKLTPDPTAKQPFKLLNAATETRTGFLSAAGFFNQNVSSNGTFDVLVTVPRYLRKRVRVQFTNNQPVIVANMICGDVNGDNQVTAADAIAIARAIGFPSSSTLDLDGDGMITVRDFNIAIVNLGKKGDPTIP